MLTLRKLSASTSDESVVDVTQFQHRAGVDDGNGAFTWVGLNYSGLLISNGSDQVAIPMGELLVLGKRHFPAPNPAPDSKPAAK